MKCSETPINQQTREDSYKDKNRYKDKIGPGLIQLTIEVSLWLTNKFKTNILSRAKVISLNCLQCPCKYIA